MADDLSWIDHPANIRANAALLRIVADQSLLHADDIERLRAENAMLRNAILKSDDAHWTPAMRAALTTGERDD